MPEPYYADDTVQLHHGDCREVLPTLNERFDCAVADPPYQQTRYAWDRWPDGWPAAVAAVTSSMWCFGSMRMFLGRHAEFAGWRLSQDVVWDKGRGTGYAADRFKHVHELALHWYRGSWPDVYHVTPRIAVDYRTQGNSLPAHSGQAGHYTGGKRAARSWTDDGTRLTQSIIAAPTMWRRGAIHPAQKSQEILRPLVQYACPPGGVVLDPFAGSGSTAVVARLLGCRAVLIEANEADCEKIARRLSQDVLPIGEAS